MGAGRSSHLAGTGIHPFSCAAPGACAPNTKPAARTAPTALVPALRRSLRTEAAERAHPPTPTPPVWCSLRTAMWTARCGTGPARLAQTSGCLPGERGSFPEQSDASEPLRRRGRVPHSHVSATGTPIAAGERVGFVLRGNAGGGSGSGAPSAFLGGTRAARSGRRTARMCPPGTRVPDLCLVGTRPASERGRRGS
jgi:hypothetical protein